MNWIIRGTAIVAFAWAATVAAVAQGLFEQALGGDVETSDERTPDPLASTRFELNGVLRATAYGGKAPGRDAGEIKNAYGEAALLMRARKGTAGDAYGELRIRRGALNSGADTEIVLREAYVNAYAGPFDLRLGEQIIAWGRADGINPTDNLTPRDLRVRSPNEDDRRLANFAARAFYNADPVRVEFVWLPFFAPSYFPLLNLPAAVRFAAPAYPNADLANGTAAIRLHLLRPGFDASFSYLRGEATFPTIILRDVALRESGPPELRVAFAAYRHEVVGADFSTTFGSWGLRGEAAYRRPLDESSSPFIPLRDLEAVLGVDREVLGVSVIAQYIGRIVFDWTEIATTGLLEGGDIPPQQLAQMRARVPALARQEIARKNRMIHGQLDRISHAVSLRLQRAFRHETLSAEIAGLARLTTKEWLVRPQLSYDLADALTGTVGAELYIGPDETLFGTIDETMSAGYVQLKASF